MDSNLKYGVHSKAKNSEKRPRMEAVSVRDDSLEKMMVVGKGVPLSRSKMMSSGYHLHECHSDTAVNSLSDGNAQHKDSVPREGFHSGLSEYPSASSLSFASATSNFSTSDTLQKKLHELENELSGKDATISFLRKQLNRDGDSNVEYNSVAVETDMDFETHENHDSKLYELKNKLEKREKTIMELSKELEESIKLKGRQVEENRNLNHEVYQLNRQLQSTYEFVQSQQWDTGINPQEFATLQGRISELEDSLALKQTLVNQLEETIKEKKLELDKREKLLAEATKRYFEFKDVSTTEITELADKVSQMERESRDRERQIQDERAEAQRCMDEKILSVTRKLEAQYQEEIKVAVERCRSSFKKLSEMPKSRLEHILSLCESGEFDIVVLKKQWDDHKSQLEKKLSLLNEEKSKEINCLVERYESKILSLKSQIESLNEQLRERKETLDAFEAELKLYRNEKGDDQGIDKSCNFQELKQLHAAEILSQQEKHKLEKEFLQNKVKRLSEEILSHAKNEKMQLQELQSAKLMASTFREKYERLLAELEEKMNSKKASDNFAMIHELELQDSIDQFKSLILSLKKAEEMHEDKIKFLKKLDQDELMIHQREMNLFKVKLEQVDRFQSRLLELDNEIKELIMTIEAKYSSTVHCLSNFHFTEVKLKELEIDSMEHKTGYEINGLRQQVQKLEETNSELEKKMKEVRHDFETKLRAMTEQAQELTVELLKNEGMLAIKAEIEDTLTQRITQMESLLDMKNETSQKELENALSKCLTVEALLSAKEELMLEYEARISETEKILSRSNDQMQDIGEKFTSIGESFKKFENVSQIIFDMKNCENYFILKTKIERLAILFEELCKESKNTGNELDHVSKTNVKLTSEKKDLAEKYQEIVCQKDEILNSYRELEKEIKEVMERSIIYEKELNRFAAEHKLIEKKCNDIIRFKCRESESEATESDITSSLADKIDKIGDKLSRSLAVAELDKDKIIRCVEEKAEEKLEMLERERVLREERDEILASNTFLRDNIEALTERVDLLLRKLSGCESYKNMPSNSEDVAVQYSISIRGTGDHNEESSAFREEMMEKLESIQKEMTEVVKEKNSLISNFEILAEERDRLKDELAAARRENTHVRLDSQAADVSVDRPGNDPPEELSWKDEKMSGMRREIRHLVSRVKTLSRELDEIKQHNEMLVSESRHQIQSNQCLKDELEEVWSQRYEIEDQLSQLRRENAVLNLHRDQLEQTNKRISTLISDGTPSVVSWMKIHETVENIVDVVQSLKSSFVDLNPDPSKLDQLKHKSDSKTLPAALQDELENKTKLCRDLVSQKVMLEKELEYLEDLMKRSENSEYASKHLDIAESQNDPVVDFLPEATLTLTEKEMEMLNQADEEPYLRTLNQLKKRFQDQVHLQEAQMNEALANEIEGLKKKMLVSAVDVDALRKRHREEVSEINREYEAELAKLRNIIKEMRESGNDSLVINEIEAKHAEQMEELRRYYEKKCAELERNFSEEVFSQHSRKMSEGSDGTCDEVPDVCDIGRSSDAIEKCRVILDGSGDDEDDDEDDVNGKKSKLLKYVTEIVAAHAEELNFVRTKHSKETANLRRKHLQDIEELRREIERVKEASDKERETMQRDCEKRVREAAIEERKTVAAELERQFETRVREEIKKLSELLAAEVRAREEGTAELEETCVEKLSENEMESALKRVETEKRLMRRSEERFKRELEEEKLKIAQHYKDLNEAALKRFNEEQENLIRSHSEVMQRLVHEHEERIAELKRAHRQDLERFHCDEEIKLVMEFRDKEKKFERELSSIKSTYEDELYELKKCCQNTLNEQVSLAKEDAFNTLQKQIQEYLNGETEDSLASKEVIQLGEKFAGRYRREIEELKEKHHGEVTRIRSEYEDRIRRRYSTGSLPRKSLDKMELRTDDDKLQILRERDSLQEMVSSLRHVLAELIRYIGSCEDELNNTILVEFGKGEETMYKSFQINSSELTDADCSSFYASRKVHFAPDLSGIMNEIDSDSIASVNTTHQVRMELDRCLKQLKTDASQLLALSANSGRKPHEESMYELLLKLGEEKAARSAGFQEKVAGGELDRSRETVSEGYVEEMVNTQKYDDTLVKLAEKAKALLSEKPNHSSDILNVLDDICKEGDRLQDEARRERHDLQQQVDAADKQLRSTRKFLEEQAAEREVERDDYMNEMKKLREALKARDREKAVQDRMIQEMETLESQLREANGRLAEAEQSKADFDHQLKEAIDKIWSLRDIVRELETQVASASEKNDVLQRKLDELERINEEQSKVNRELAIELENIKTQTTEEYEEQVKELEEELDALRRAADRLSPEAVLQMNVGLREIEIIIAKKTKDLEQLHAGSANVSCSSPTEDITLCERLDATRCPTPIEMQCADGHKMGLPLDEIDRINDKLVRHTRAEEVAVKMIRDLEMQLKSNRKSLEELQIERDVLLEKADTYLKENSRLKDRLDEQRCSAGIIQRQLSADLEAQIKRLELDIEKLNDICVQKDKQLRDMNIILEQTTKSLKIREAEALNKSNEENELITSLKMELRNTVEEKKGLEESLTKLKETLRETVTVPVLIDSMLEEKNAEIDRLEKEVLRLSKERATSSLIKSHSSASSSSDSHKSLKQVKFSEPDSFVQFISPIQALDHSVMRCASDSYNDLKISSCKIRKSNNWMAVPESLSSIGPLQLSPRGGSDVYTNWNNPAMSSPKEEEKVTNVEYLQRELSEKTEELKRYETELSKRSNLDAEINEIQLQLKSTLDAVEEDKFMYKKEFESMLATESKLQTELDCKRREVSEGLLEIDRLKRELAEVNLSLETVRSDYQRLEGELLLKDEEIRKVNSNAESLLITIETLKRNHLDEVEEIQEKLNFEHNRVESVLGELKILEVKKVEIEEEFLSMKEDYYEKLTSQEKLVETLKEEVSELNEKNRELSDGWEKCQRDLAEKLSNVESENDKLTEECIAWKIQLDRCLAKMADRADAVVQVYVPTNDRIIQTGSERPESSEELADFQVKIDKLKLEMATWEKRMNESDFDRNEALSYAALVRTLIANILENLDDHFYELQTYRRKVMECSVDDLTDKVQKELLLSAKLDNKLLSNFQADQSQSATADDQSALIDLGAGGDNNLSESKKKQNLVNLTVRLYELETNLQDLEQRNKEFEQQIDTLRQERDEEKRRAEGLQMLVKLVESELAMKKAKLEEEKSRYDEDAKIMEVLRVNFELSVEKMKELEGALSVERQVRKSLEMQLNIMKSPRETAEVSEAVTVSELKCQLEMEKQKAETMNLSLEKEKRKCQDLKLQLEQEKLERMTDKDMQRFMNKDLTLLQEQKDNLESQLSFARELLQTRQSEIVSLKRKINLQEIDIKALSLSGDNLRDKELELSMMSDRVSELEKEVSFYRTQIQTLSEKSENISAPLLMKMRNLNNCVEQHVQESNEMDEALLNLTHETEEIRCLIRKIGEAAANKSGGTISNSSDETIVPEAEMERRRWADERQKLVTELEKARSDYDVLKRDSMDVFKTNDSLKLEIKKLTKELSETREEAVTRMEVGISEDRVLHLFGKYMRTESFRKALAFQKLYLTSVLNGYEGSEEALARYARSTRRREAKRKRRGKRKTFKEVVLVVIAIKRMQFMVVRWRICRVSAFNALMSQYDAPNANKENECQRHTPVDQIDPLRYQTHNFLRQHQRSSPNMTTPTSRDPGWRRSRQLDTRKITANIERINQLHKSLGVPSRTSQA